MNSLRKSLSRSLYFKSKNFIAVGDKFPNVSVNILESKGGEYEKASVSTGDLFAKGRFVVVGYPGAFTPTCTATHIPEYIQRANEIQGGGVDKVFALSVNDPFVVKVFAEQLGGKQKISYIADGNGDLTKALNVGLDLSAAGLGTRCKRFSLLIENGKVTQFNDEQGPKMTDISRVSQVLSQLKKK